MGIVDYNVSKRPSNYSKAMHTDRLSEYYSTTEGIPFLTNIPKQLVWSLMATYSMTKGMNI